MNATSSKGLIGKAIPRKEDIRLLRGRGRYVDNVPDPPGTLHLTFVLSPHAHARIVSIDTEAAAQIEGVHAIYTGRDFAGRIRALTPDIEQPGFQPVGREAMPVDRVRFVGEGVAVVVAADRYTAEDAAELVQVEYEELPVIGTVEAALAADTVPVDDNTRDNVLFRAALKTDSFDAAFAGAHLVVGDTFHSPRLAALSLEQRGCLAIYDNSLENLTLYTSTQIPHIVRTALAEALDSDHQTARDRARRRRWLRHEGVSLSRGADRRLSRPQDSTLRSNGPATGARICYRACKVAAWFQCRARFQS